MSLWGATVITNLLSAIPWIGKDFVEFIWGGFSVGNATLNRFFSLHYLLPFILAALAVVHMLTLHTNGSWSSNLVLNLYIFLFIHLFLYLFLDFNLFDVFIQTPNLNNIILFNSSVLAFIIPNIRAIKRIGPHNEDIISALVGSLLGDCTAERLGNGGIRFIFKQGSIHESYFFFLYNFFLIRGYSNNNIPAIKTQTLNEQEFGYYVFRTYSFTSLLWLYNLFYHNGKKMIPLNIADYLTPLALAIWIQDDGTWTNYGVRIATNCFTKAEIELLIKALLTNFDIKSSIHKNGKQLQLYIKNESKASLRNLVLPYFDKSMHYKLGIK